MILGYQSAFEQGFSISISGLVISVAVLTCFVDLLIIHYLVELRSKMCNKVEDFIRPLLALNPLNPLNPRVESLLIDY